jgi:predicted transcriptional regulator YdeE
LRIAPMTRAPYLVKKASILQPSTIYPQNKPLTQFWGECFGNGPTEHLINQRKDKSLLGILLDCNQATEQLTYMIGAMEEQATDLQGYSSQIIPAATWWSKFLVIFNLS